VHEALLTWAADRGRDLPWRATRDPWAVLVSEAMLQQTQVARVVPRFRAFLDRFPDVGGCAAAPLAEVVRAWAGLGYNRRAVNLHRAATAVVEHHGGVIPNDLDALLALPGIGPYTARAVLAFAFDADVGVLDVNGQRVLSRVTGDAVTQAGADALVPADRGWAWNQAVLDLGATLCKARPRCDECPVVAHCAWHGRGRAEPDPWRRGPRQSAFAGSDRQGRGRLVEALRRGPLPLDPPALARAAGWPGDPDRARGVADALVADGLAVVRGRRLHLP
jgi:A/G-specific adenine glycosylase